MIYSTIYFKNVTSTDVRPTCGQPQIFNGLYITCSELTGQDIASAPPLNLCDESLPLPHSICATKMASLLSGLINVVLLTTRVLDSILKVKITVLFFFF